MIDPLSALKSLNRPTLLVTAARLALPGYSREKELPRLLNTPNVPGRNQCILKLMELESELNAQRRAKDHVYGPARHVKILSALMHESQHPRAPKRRQLKASATSDFLRAI